MLTKCSSEFCDLQRVCNYPIWNLLLVSWQPSNKPIPKTILHYLNVVTLYDMKFLCKPDSKNELQFDQYFLRFYHKYLDNHNSWEWIKADKNIFKYLLPLNSMNTYFIELLLACLNNFIFDTTIFNFVVSSTFGI